MPNPFTKYIYLGVGLAFAALCAAFAWANSERVEWRDLAYQFMTPLEQAHGAKPGSYDPKKDGFEAIVKLDFAKNTAVNNMNQYKRERDNARAVIKEQSDSIRYLGEETAKLRALNREQRKLAQKLIEDRNYWIAKAKQAASRTEQRTCEEEIAEVEEVLDALFENGF